MSRAVTLFIVEGENRDWRFVDQMAGTFLQGRFATAVVSMPASQNIYMLYERLESDGFDTDVVEVLRESVPAAKEALDGISRGEIGEVYLFFDYDPHHDNIPGGGSSEAALDKMLEFFDNETENGKLYISYPMVEALYDYRESRCQAFSSCLVPLADIGSYKRMSGKGNPNASGHMEIGQWKDILAIYPLKVRCLLGLDAIDFDSYREAVTTESILESQRLLGTEQGLVFVLSAFPQFLYDYFKRDFWNARAHLSRPRYSNCPKQDL